jgi:2-octaprenylphenol hydroxylase
MRGNPLDEENMKNLDVIVVGGGLVGAAFVLDMALQNPKLEIGLLEPKPVELPDLSNILDNKIYAISPHNLEYLDSIGGFPHMNRMGVIQKMDIFGDNKSNLLFDAKLANKFFLAKTVEYGYLQQHLYKKLEDLLNVHFIYGHVDSIITNEQSATINCGDIKYTTQLVVGSDGANSVVRKYAGIETKLIDYEQGGVVANFECELPHKNTAYQWFYQGNTLAYLPLPGNKISIVWSCQNYKELLNLDSMAFCERVAKAGDYKLGGLKLLAPAVSFPLRLYVLEKLYAKRIVLIGDAAHTIHPLAGQGVNLGFSDARFLASIIGKVPQYQLGDESLLAKYNAKRLPFIYQMQLICHALHNLFNTRQSAASGIRNLGLNLINSLPKIKKHLISEAIKY